MNRMVKVMTMKMIMMMALMLMVMKMMTIALVLMRLKAIHQTGVCKLASATRELFHLFFRGEGGC